MVMISSYSIDDHFNEYFILFESEYITNLLKEIADHVNHNNLEVVSHSIWRDGRLLSASVHVKKTGIMEA